jgi:hypothetical protein
LPFENRDYGFFVVVLVVVFVVVFVESIFIVLSCFMLVSIPAFMPVSVVAGAGAIAGAAVSVAGSSFFVVQAATAITAATRARRFIYILLGRGANVGGPTIGTQKRCSNSRQQSRVQAAGVKSAQRAN